MPGEFTFPSPYRLKGGGPLALDPDEHARRKQNWLCNDCARPAPMGEELCRPCQRKLSAAEEWELLHPEARCPPRE
jgi:hypothetical protein